MEKCYRKVIGLSFRPIVSPIAKQPQNHQVLWHLQSRQQLLSRHIHLVRFKALPRTNKAHTDPGFTTRSQRGETYILENYGGYNPGRSGGQHKGTLTSDGATYDIYRVDRGNGYMQFWSIRQQKSSSGVVTTKNHYDKYNSLGLVFDPAKNATYQIVSTEGYQSTGSSDITVSEVLVANGTSTTVVPTCVTDSRDKPLPTK